MELITFIIWSVVIILTTIILVYLLLNPKNFNQEITNRTRLFWSLVISGFAIFIFGLVAKPYINYNYCMPFNANAGFFKVTVINCDTALWLILLFSYLFLNVFLQLLLFNMRYF